MLGMTVTLRARLALLFLLLSRCSLALAANSTANSGDARNPIERTPICFEKVPTVGPANELLCSSSVRVVATLGRDKLLFNPYGWNAFTGYDNVCTILLRADESVRAPEAFFPKNIMDAAAAIFRACDDRSYNPDPNKNQGGRVSIMMDGEFNEHWTVSVTGAAAPPFPPDSRRPLNDGELAVENLTALHPTALRS